MCDRMLQRRGQESRSSGRNTSVIKISFRAHGLPFDFKSRLLFTFDPNRGVIREFLAITLNGGNAQSILFNTNARTSTI